MKIWRFAAIAALVALLASACGPGTTAAPEAPGESIGVHGSWTIEVLDPDGSLDERVEFDNALTDLGARRLSNIMAGTTDIFGNLAPAEIVGIAAGDRGGLDFDGVPPCTHPYDDERLESGFIVGHNSVENPPPLVADTACVIMVEALGGEATTSVDASPPHAFTISGSVVAEQEGTIDFVETWVYEQVEDSIIGTEFFIALTRKTGDPLPIDVEEGQTLQISVSITFGTS